MKFLRPWNPQKVGYVYTISVQGHGDYPTEPVLSDPEIKVTGAGI